MGKTRALPIWSEFINACNKGTKIIFTTVSDESRKAKIGSKYYSLTEKDIINALREGIRSDVQLVFLFSSKKIMGRSIETDQFYIQLEHGLGMFRKSKKGYINNAGMDAHIIVTQNEK